jgi:hypothetical protein
VPHHDPIMRTPSQSDSLFLAPNQHVMVSCRQAEL